MRPRAEGKRELASALAVAAKQGLWLVMVARGGAPIAARNKGTKRTTPASADDCADQEGSDEDDSSGAGEDSGLDMSDEGVDDRNEAAAAAAVRPARKAGMPARYIE